jgi:hypothetical protein
MIKRYVKKPIITKAIQWDRNNYKEVLEWVPDSRVEFLKNLKYTTIITTSEDSWEKIRLLIPYNFIDGSPLYKPSFEGDCLVKNPEDKLYEIMKPEKFHRIYEELL